MGRHGNVLGNVFTNCTVIGEYGPNLFSFGYSRLLGIQAGTYSTVYLSFLNLLSGKFIYKILQSSQLFKGQH